MRPSIYRPRRPRASPLWQLVHHAWDDFLAGYEASHRRIHGPLSPDSIDVVDQFYRCGDLAAGFTRLQCPDCGHEKLLAFTCKTRHFCPSCHQRRVRRVGDWIAHTVCFDVETMEPRSKNRRLPPGLSKPKGSHKMPGRASNRAGRRRNAR